eukprot:gene22842-biopygen20776
MPAPCPRHARATPAPLMPKRSLQPAPRPRHLPVPPALPRVGRARRWTFAPTVYAPLPHRRCHFGPTGGAPPAGPPRPHRRAASAPPVGRFLPTLGQGGVPVHGFHWALLGFTCTPNIVPWSAVQCCGVWGAGVTDRVLFLPVPCGAPCNSEELSDTRETTLLPSRPGRWSL